MKDPSLRWGDGVRSGVTVLGLGRRCSVWGDGVRSGVTVFGLGRHGSGWGDVTHYVIPAKAGISMKDPSLRWGDGVRSRETVFGLGIRCSVWGDGVRANLLKVA